MTKRLWILVPLVALVLSSCVMWDTGYDRPYPPRSPYGGGYNGPARDVSYFYEYLSPYGSWVMMRPWGYVWIPRHMGYRWRPYADGRWVWTDYGWTWISEYDWGWIPFHYGRWGWDDDLGWFWVPDTVWGPAWVSWRTSGLYFGWAPVPPGVDYDLRAGLGRMPGDIPWNLWIFVEGRDFLEMRLGGRLLPPERNQTILRNTVFRVSLANRGDRVFNEGPDLNLVRQTTMRRVDSFRIVDSGQAGPAQVSGGQIRIFRPDVHKVGGAAPKESVDYSEARRTLGDAKIYEAPDRRPDAAAGLDALRLRHQEELSVLDRSQSGELRDLQQRFADRERRLRDAGEKDKIHKEMDGAVADLKSKHDQERQALTERQKKDQAAVQGHIIK